MATVALRLVMSASDCEAVPNDSTHSTCCAALPLCCWIGGMGVCASLVRTVCKSLARVLTAIALDLSLSVSCNACCDAVCVLAAPSPSVCMGVAESAAAD